MKYANLEALKGPPLHECGLGELGLKYTFCEVEQLIRTHMSYIKANVMLSRLDGRKVNIDSLSQIKGEAEIAVSVAYFAAQERGIRHGEARGRRMRQECRTFVENFLYQQAPWLLDDDP